MKGICYSLNKKSGTTVGRLEEGSYSCRDYYCERDIFMHEFVRIYVYMANTPPRRGVVLLAEISAPCDALLSDVTEAVELKKGLDRGGCLFYYDIVQSEAVKRTRRTPLNRNDSLAETGLLSGSFLLYSNSTTVKNPVFMSTGSSHDSDE